MSKTEPETGPGNSILPQPGTAANTSETPRHDSLASPARLAFYGRTNQRGQGARTELAVQLGLCRAVAGRQAVITRTHYDIPEPVTGLPGFAGIDAGGLPGAGGWDELAAAMGSPDGRDFEAVICTTADRIARRIPVLLAREEFARRCGTPVLCVDELALPGQFRAIVRQLRRWPFTPPVPGIQAPEGTISRVLSWDAPTPAAGCSRPAARPCPCACNNGGFCGGVRACRLRRPAGRRPAMSVITIVHTERDGTLIEGSSKGDGVYEVLLDLRRRGQGNWRYFRSLGQLGLGQSRDKPAQRWKIDTAAEALRAAGYEVEVSIDNDTRRTFAEAEAERYQRAEDRALYHDAVADRAAGRAEAASRAEHRIIDSYPLGQPILVGHHSERRHRRDLERADAHRRRAWAEQDKAGYHADRADAAERYQAGRESVPVTLRRIAKLEAEARQIQRRLDGTDKFMSYGHPATGEWREQLLARARDIDEELGYWRKHVAARQADGAKVWEPADFARGDFVQIGLGAWYEVIRVNKKTLTLPAIIAGPGRTVLRASESGYPWTDTVPYDQVTARKSAAEIAELTATPAHETTSGKDSDRTAAQQDHAPGRSLPGTEAEIRETGPDDER